MDSFVTMYKYRNIEMFLSVRLHCGDKPIFSVTVYHTVK